MIIFKKFMIQKYEILPEQAYENGKNSLNLLMQTLKGSITFHKILYPTRQAKAGLCILATNNQQAMEKTRKLEARKRIALIAHDNKKKELMDWAVYNKNVLTTHILYATGTTGKLLEEVLGTTVTRMHSGPLGGDLQIGAMIAEGTIDIIIFFWDPMESQPHDPDIKALLRITAVWNIPMACDRATADFLMTSPFMHEEYEALLPDYTQYLTRKVQS